MSRPDVAVIGAGMVGAMIADALVRAGCRVLVIEEAFPGAGSTGAAMGHLVVMDDSPAQLRLSDLSRSRWRDMLPGLPAASEVDRTGTLWLAATQAEFDAAARPRCSSTAGRVWPPSCSTRRDCARPSRRFAKGWSARCGWSTTWSAIHRWWPGQCWNGPWPVARCSTSRVT